MVGMATFKFPANDYDEPATLLELLGSFWSDTYPDQTVEDLVAAYALGAKQTHADMLELLAACSRQQVPIYHQLQWYHLVLKESEHNTNPSASLSTYGGGAVYGTDPTTGVELVYGQPYSPYSTFPIPAELRECPLLFNRLTQASFTLVLGVDFVIDTENQVVIFKDNPFDNELFARRDVYTDGEVTDREVSIWAFRPRVDADDIYTQFGYPLQFELASSETYRDAANAAWNGLIRGTAKQDIQAFVSAICDVPLAAGSETVQLVQLDDDVLVIATDQNVYRFNPAATAIVEKGDKVHAGQPLTDTVEFIEFGRGDYGTLQAVSLGPGLLPAGYLDSITFHDEDADLEVDTSGVFTKVSFHVGGWPGDVEQFWDDFHTRGILQGQTLAQLLDQRTNKVGEPGASNLPTTINPLEFAAKNILRNNAFAVKVHFNHRGPGAVSMQHFRQLRRLVVPGTAMLIMTELSAPDDDVTLTDYSETQEPYLAGEPISDTLAASSVIEVADLQYIDGHCI
jgi:hypothetical protein